MEEREHKEAGRRLGPGEVAPPAGGGRGTGARRTRGEAKAGGTLAANGRWRRRAAGGRDLLGLVRATRGGAKVRVRD